MKSQRRPSVCFFVLSTTLIFASRAQSSQPPVLVFNSFGPGNSYITYADWGISGASGLSGGFVGHAELFVPSVSGNLYSLQVAVGQLSGGTGLVNFSVAADDGGTPGATLESFLNEQAPSPGSGVLTINSITQPLLQAGATYWLCAEPAQSTTAIGWFVTDQGFKNDYAQEGPPGQWTSGHITFENNGAFDVSVLPVPEPSMMGLMILGAGSFSLRRVRERRLSRPSAR
jgi:hypothetical protein